MCLTLLDNTKTFHFRNVQFKLSGQKAIPGSGKKPDNFSEKATGSLS